MVSIPTPGFPSSRVMPHLKVSHLLPSLHKENRHTFYALRGSWLRYWLCLPLTSAHLSGAGF